MDIRRDEYNFYRRGSNISEASFMADVDMAQDEMFSGPTSESVPTSSVGFASRRPRADSTTSFTYYDEEEHQEDSDSWLEEEAAITEEPEVEDTEDLQNGFADHGADIEAANGSATRRRTSSKISRRSRTSRASRGSHTSVEDPLLKRHDSSGSGVSNLSTKGARDRHTQKIYIQSEDLTMVIAGFRTSIIGYCVYLILCAITAGLGYLLFRWVPRWRLRLTGSAAPLRECKWVVVEVSQLFYASMLAC